MTNYLISEIANADPCATQCSGNLRAECSRKAPITQPRGGYINAFPSTPKFPYQHRNIAYSEPNQWLQELNSRLGVVQTAHNQIFYYGSSTNGSHKYLRAAYTPPAPLALLPLVTNSPRFLYTQAHIPSTPLPVIRKWLRQRFDYGDCSESIPLAVIASITSQIGPAAEVRSFAAFTNKLCRIQSIAEDGEIDISIDLKGPCKNCKNLMARIPGSTWMLTGSGKSENVHWTAEKRGSLHSRELQQVQSEYSRISYSAALAANKTRIFQLLKLWTIECVGEHVRADVRRNLATMWHEFVVPYRTNNKIFRLNASGEVDAIMIRINNISIPICTVFCAVAYILSTTLEPSAAQAQTTSYFLPLMAILAKWCQTLCPWGRPNVISIVGITSRSPYGIKRFLLGTSKPFLKPRVDRRCINGRHLDEIKLYRTELLEKVFGWLPDLSPERVDAGIN